MIKVYHHDHDHGSGHHSHEGITAFEGIPQAVAIITYMLEHNRSHAEELHNICHRLEESGQIEAAALIDKAVDQFRNGNNDVEIALELLKKAEA